MHDFQGATSTLLLSLPIDAEQNQDELRLLRALSQELTTELFQTCCEIQRDPSALDPLELSALVYTLQIVSGRLRELDPAQPAA